MPQLRPALPSLAAAALLGLAACGEQQPPRDTGAERAAPTDPGMAGEAAATGAAPVDEASPPAPADAAGTRSIPGAAEPVRDGVATEPLPEGVPPAIDVPPEEVREAPDTGAPPPARPASDPTR